MTHLVTKAIGIAIKEFPDATGKITLGNYIKFSTIDASLLVSLDQDGVEGSDVFYVNVPDVEHKSLQIIAQEVKEKVSSLRTGEEQKKFKESMVPLRPLPACFITVVTEVVLFFTAMLGIPVPLFNLKRHPFGSFIVTSLGMHKCSVSYVPPAPLLRCPLLFTITTVHDEPVVENSEVVIRPILNLCYTADIRYFDSLKLLLFTNRIKEILENPSHFLLSLN